MDFLRKIRNYYFYCGIEKDEYNAIKKDAYVSNFRVWRILHFLMAAVFGFLFAISTFNDMLKTNRSFYLIIFIYSVIAIFLFFVLKKDSIIAQLLIYLSISLLFLFSCLITANSPENPAISFIAFLLLTPMLMIDKPFFMAIELIAASSVFLIWMYHVKPYDIWLIDLINIITYTVVGIFLNIIANAIRIREFVLTRKINIQKDTDGLTGLKNKDALTREIDEFLADDSADKGIMFLFDIDRFKKINDTFGHDVGDGVIHQLGSFLGGILTSDEIAGRFGGDEFVLFVKNTDDRDAACQLAESLIRGAAENVVLPDRAYKVSMSIGIAIYRGQEKNYSDIFKKADTALYLSKADPENRFRFYE